MEIRSRMVGRGRVPVVTTLTVALALILGGLASATASAPQSASKSTSKSASKSGSKVVSAVAVTQRSDEPRPTVVLVHGAFADASGWASVASRLMAEGYPVYAPPNPLRGLQGDTDYLKSFLSTIEGPIVLVGHSYGGAIITNAATDNPQVKALVYVAAYALDEGETVGKANYLGGHPEESLLLANVEPRPYPGAPEGDVDVYIKLETFHQVFAADIPRKQAEFMAVAQRPGSYFSLGTPSGVPGWKTVPSWYVVASQDKAIPPTAQRFMADRAGSETVTVPSSHVAMMSHPGRVSSVIEAAADAH